MYFFLIKKTIVGSSLQNMKHMYLILFTNMIKKSFVIQAEKMRMNRTWFSLFNLAAYVNRFLYSILLWRMLQSAYFLWKPHNISWRNVHQSLILHSPTLPFIFSFRSCRPKNSHKIFSYSCRLFDVPTYCYIDCISISIYVFNHNHMPSVRGHVEYQKCWFRLFRLVYV